MEEKKKIPPTISQEDWDTCINVLQTISKHPDAILEELHYKTLITKLYKTARKRIRKENLARKKQADQALTNETYIFQRNDETVKQLPTAFAKRNKHLQTPKNCYICKKNYYDLHFFYHLICPDCAALNYQKRQKTTDLSNRIALITGGRIKIGFELALMMLRDGAEVIVTTRFPEDASRRYAAQNDYEQWKNRLHIYGLDFRNLVGVEAFITHIQERFDYLDVLINNAAQTIKRPLEFYQHLIAQEKKNYLLEVAQSTKGLVLSHPYFPNNALDKDGIQIDLRPKNSWTTKLEEVSTLEMLEVQLVNTTVPFMLNSSLKKMLLQSPNERKFIVNVSAVEGQFNRIYKSANHPHTNMAKAALNMMTRTAAQDYALNNIFMTSVDTGWITDEKPHPSKANMRQKGFVTPLDIVDGAARVYHPIVAGLEEEKQPYFGVFLKDYRVVEW